MQNIWALTDTISLLPVCESIKPEANYLVKTFFPNALPAGNSSYVAVEFRRQGRVLAPYVVKGSRGVNINRGSSQVDLYKAPLVAPRRTISLDDVELRMFGEQPVFSTITPAERQARMQADDLTELMRMVENTKNKQAADILQHGKTTIKGFADDGKTEVIDKIDFQWDGRVDVTTDWSNSAADIYSDIKAASDDIQEKSGYVPTLMLCGKNVERKLLNNAEIFKWLQIPNRENLAVASFAPHYTSPQARFIGNLTALNLEIISYAETYTDDAGNVQSFIDPDAVIIGVPGIGKQLFGAVTYMDNSGNFTTVSAENVPVYRWDVESQQSSLTIFSRFLMVPSEITSWVTLNTKIS